MNKGYIRCSTSLVCRGAALVFTTSPSHVPQSAYTLKMANRFVQIRQAQEKPPQSNPSRRNAAQQKIPTGKAALKQAVQQPSPQPTRNIASPVYKTKDERPPQQYGHGHSGGQYQAHDHPQPQFDDDNTLHTSDINSTNGDYTDDNESVAANRGQDTHYLEDQGSSEGGSQGEHYETEEDEHIEEDDRTVRGHQIQGYDTYAAPGHQEQHLSPSRKHSPMLHDIDERNIPAKAGFTRFQDHRSPPQTQPLQHVYQSIQHRPSHNGNGEYQEGASKKRGRVQGHSPQPQYNEEEFRQLQNFEAQRQMDHKLPPDDDLPKTFTHAPAMETTEEPRSEEPEPTELDYDDAILKNMSFSDLRKESFEHDPHRTTNGAGENLEVLEEPGRQAGTSSKPPKSELEQRWHNCLQSDPDEHQKIHEVFYSQLTIAEWEETGELFVDRFGDIMKRITEARRERRRIVAEGENEIEKREELVRGKSANYEENLQGMKANGQSVLRGKLLGNSSTVSTPVRKA
ncbi:extracellular mutant protein 11-domain-containing protein [Calycina marina]|uniref:Extracellular mutant protein 11-domain-containing protein n=1 Tax=Calycina marina TaxID=1763456 RepID=A0A9P7YVL1_9HELO|nr:extracellular mutant protein 11-domain-containing protein [Calycina marina]